MGGGLAFLTKKSFNPANWSNQRQVWEARQKHATEQRRITEREAQLKREREEEEMARMMGGEEEGGRKALGFMYEGGRIPGLKREDQPKDDDDEFRRESVVGEERSNSLFERQPGDDDAAAAFRAMLARGAVEETRPTADTPATELAAAPTDEQEEKTEYVDNRTALEKAVGRGINSGSGVTLTQQMERFPMLKHAPMVLQKPKDGEAEQSTDVAGLNFKPLGQVLRNVKCLSCGKWGHSKGDRECEVSGWDPFSMGASMNAGTAPPMAAVKSVPATKEVSDVQMAASKPTEEHKTDHRNKKKEKRRHKEDRNKKKRKHKHRRKRSPSYSSESDSDSYHSRRRESSRRRKHKRQREKSKSPSYSRY